MYVDYAMNADSIGKEHTYIDKQRLEIGRDCAKYSSLFLKQFVGSTRVSKDKQAIMITMFLSKVRQQLGLWG